MNFNLATVLPVLLCSVIAAAAMLFFAGFQGGVPPWMLGKNQLLAGLVFAAFMGLAILVTYRDLYKKNTWLRLTIRTLIIGILVSLPIVALVLFLGPGLIRIPKFSISSSLFVTLLCLYFALLFLNSLPMRGRTRLLLNLGILVVAALPSIVSILGDGADRNTVDESQDSNVATDHVFSSLYDVKLTSQVVLPNRRVYGGGGLSVVDDSRLLLVSGGGDIKLLHVEEKRISRCSRKPEDAI